MENPKRIAVIGGGPAGLYFAISMKLRDASAQIDLFERNRADDTFGWGVVFSDQTVENLMANDPVSGATIAGEFAHWDDIDVHFGGTIETSGGHGFIGIGRKRLLQILQTRARELGVALHFEHTASADLSDYPDYDLVIAADGANSALRTAYETRFGVDIDWRRNRFTWLGTRKLFDAFTFAFEKLPEGWVWAHAYRFDSDLSTFIVEMAPETFDALGFEQMEQAESIARCEQIFEEYLDNNSLMTNAAHLSGAEAWRHFPRILCDAWHFRQLILIGDAAHTAHFSVGSGTKLALEDAIKLAEVLNRPSLALETALTEYREERNLEVLKLQNAARNSTEWFETLERYTDFHPKQFAYSLLTRSQRVSHDNLRLRDPQWLASVECWFAGTGEPIPPMFAPFKLREMELANRIVVSPMATYSASEGMPGDFHLVHYGSRATGGAGLVFTEMTCVSPEARITPGCAGIWTESQACEWRRITDYAHAHSHAKICLQLGHSGPKGSTRVGWEGYDVPLEAGNWPVMAASDVPWSADNQKPVPMTRADMDDVREQFVTAVQNGIDAGFDMIELHAAHGYLLSSFITPLTNRRADDYGGSLENRLRFPLEIFAAMRDAWPGERPMSVRISANDWMGQAGVTPDEAVAIGEAFARAGADLIDVSAGQTWKPQRPVYGRMFQTPFSDQLRNEAKVRTMAVGNIYEVDHANSILAAGRADLVAMARPHLIEPYWTLHAAAQQGYAGAGASIPKPYRAGQEQLARNLARAAAMAQNES